MYDSSSKRLNMGPGLNEAVMSTYESAGLFDKPAAGHVRPSERAQKSPIEEAKGLVKEWREAQVCEHFAPPACNGDMRVRTQTWFSRT